MKSKDKTISLVVPDPVAKRMKDLAKKKRVYLSAAWTEAAKMWIEAQLSESQ